MWNRRNLPGRFLDPVAAENIESLKNYLIYEQEVEMSLTAQIILWFCFLSAHTCNPNSQYFISVKLTCCFHGLYWIYKWAIEKKIFNLSKILIFLLATIFICISIWRSSISCIMCWISVVNHFTSMVVTTFLLFLRDV